MSPGATVPVWLENNGLRSLDASLRCEETSEILKELSKYAEALMNPRPPRQHSAIYDV